MGGRRQPEGILWDKTYALWVELFEAATQAHGGDIIAAAEHLGVTKSFMYGHAKKLGADIFGKRTPKPRRPRIRPNKRKFIKGVPRVHMMSLKERQKAEQAMADLDAKK